MISGLGDEVEDMEDGCRALIFLIVSSLSVPMYVSVHLHLSDQTPVGMLLVSEMSGVHGEIKLVTWQAKPTVLLHTV